MPGQFILQYLIKVKELVSSGHWTLIPRKKNLDSLSEKGLTIGDVKGVSFYIKLKIDVANDGTEILKCLSFHEQEA